MTVDFSTGFYFHPEGPGLLFGMADPDQPPGFDQRMRDDWLERVGEVMERRAPAMLEMGVAGGWTGFYEVTPDHNALIGRAEEVEGFVYGTGFSGHGFLQSPAVGEILRDLVLGRAPFVDVGAALGLAVRPRRDAARARDRLALPRLDRVRVRQPLGPVGERASSPPPVSTICPGSASHGTVSCSSNSVSSMPASISAVTIWPRPWFHSWVTFFEKTTSVST